MSLAKSHRVERRAIRQAASGAPCMVRLPNVCDGGGQTTVLAHLRMLGGGGMGYKPDDLDAIYACHACHDYIDGRRPMPDEGLERWELYVTLLRAHCWTVRYLVERGVISIKEE